MANTKLMKVMEYLINEQEDKARDLLHQIFIEKARAIHEEMMQDDVHMGGDETEDLLKEIEAEEQYEEDTDMEDADDDVADAVEDLSDELEMDDDDDADMDVMDADEDMDADDADAADTADADADAADTADADAEYGTEDDVEHKLMDLESAIEELRKEFEAMESGTDDSAHADMEDEDEVKVDEAWEVVDEEDDFDDLAEGIAHELAQITAPKAGEVGAGKFARAETNTHSPVPSSQKDVMGAKAVKTGQGKKAQGYDRETAPESKSLGGGTGRRKDAEDNKKVVSKEGDPRALLNKDRSEGFGAANTRSPIQGRTRS
jgi:hypothetical protein